MRLIDQLLAFVAGGQLDGLDHLDAEGLDDCLHDPILVALETTGHTGFYRAAVIRITPDAAAALHFYHFFGPWLRTI